MSSIGFMILLYSFSVRVNAGNGYANVLMIVLSRASRASLAVRRPVDTYSLHCSDLVVSASITWVLLPSGARITPRVSLPWSGSTFSRSLLWPV